MKWKYGIQNPKFKDLDDKKIKDWLLQLKDLEHEFNLLGYEIYLYGGNLLGAIREGDVISTDDDFDIGWLCKSTTREQVKNEIKELYTHFKKKKLKCRTKQLLGQAHIFSNKKDRHFDTWASWFENDKFYFCFTIWGRFDKSILLPYKKVKIRGIEFNIPNKSETILKHLYGSDWKIKKDVKPIYDTNVFFKGEKFT